MRSWEARAQEQIGSALPQVEEVTRSPPVSYRRCTHIQSEALRLTVLSSEHQELRRIGSGTAVAGAPMPPAADRR
jgi:hypothetical protein